MACLPLPPDLTLMLVRLYGWLLGSGDPGGLSGFVPLTSSNVEANPAAVWKAQRLFNLALGARPLLVAEARGAVPDSSRFAGSKRCVGSSRLAGGLAPGAPASFLVREQWPPKGQGRQSCGHFSQLSWHQLGDADWVAIVEASKPCRYWRQLRHFCCYTPDGRSSLRR